MRKVFAHLASILLLTIAITSRAVASFILNVTQSGSDVVASGSGTINTSALTDSTSSMAIGGIRVGSSPYGSILSLGALGATAGSTL